MTKTKLLGVLLTAVVLLAGCDECQRATQTLTDLARAKGLLEQGLSNDSEWNTTCDTLVQSSDIFRSDADFVRSVADSRYSGVPGNCIETGYVDYCHGGWVRQPWLALLAMNEAELNSTTMTDEDVLTPGHGGGHPSHPGHPGNPGHPGHPVPHPGPHPGPRPGPHPRPPVVVYPPHYPSHPRWYWHYEPRVCEVVRVCLRYAPGQNHPGYEHVMSIAYELDQVAAGIETACQKAFQGAPPAEVDGLASETLQRISEHATPGAQNVYNGLGCNNRSGN